MSSEALRELIAKWEAEIKALLAQGNRAQAEQIQAMLVSVEAALAADEPGLQFTPEKVLERISARFRQREPHSNAWLKQWQVVKQAVNELAPLAKPESRTEAKGPSENYMESVHKSLRDLFERYECGCELDGTVIRPCDRHLEFWRKTFKKPTEAAGGPEEESHGNK